jgi:phenylpyruvate tautomerase PptA (4-oxalocrotonate tautomerase family)
MSRNPVTRRDVLLMTAAAAGAAVSPVRAQAAAAGSFGMPLVELYIPAGVLTLEQKSAVVKGFTDVIVKAMKLPADPARRLFMTIVETADGGFGVDGKVFVPRGK